MLMIGLIVFGWISFTRMGISQLPDVDFPVVNVVVTWEGSAPEVIESQVADVIEDAVMSVQGVTLVSSSSRMGQTSIKIEFDLDRDIDVALQEVQTKIAQAQKNLPEDIDPPVVTKNNPEDNPIMWLAFSGTRPTREMMAYVHDTLKNQFTTVPGVGEVILSGYNDPNLRVWVNPKALEQNEVTVEDLVNAIQKEHQEVPAGYVETPEKESNVRVMGEATNVADFEKIAIPTRQGRPIWKSILIGDVARVEEGLSDVRRMSRHMGDPAIGIGIKKQRGSNAVAVAEAVEKRMEEIRPSLPADTTLKPVFDSTRFIKEATHELNSTLILSALLTGFVCWLFLGSWSSTFNVLLAIPTSIVGAFTILYFMGFTLNTFTLLGLSLAIGIVVDDAIMVLENIFRFREQGYSKIKAAIIGARQITFAAIAATVAILAIFVPVVFMKGIIGKFFFQFGVTMSVTVVLSLIEALTLTPMRCSQYLKMEHNNMIAHKMDELMVKVVAWYTRALKTCLNNRWTVLAVSMAIFVVSLGLSSLVKHEFVPSQDESRFLVAIQTPIGSSLPFTNEVMKKAEAIVMARPDVDRYFAAIGGFGGGEVNTGMMFVTLKPPKERPVVAPATKRASQNEIMNILRDEFNKIPGVFRAVGQDLSLSGFSAQRGFPVEFNIRGPNWDKLAELNDTFMQKMKDTGRMTDIDSDYKLGMPELRVIPNREKANARGVTMESIGTTVNALVGGVRAGKYTQNAKRYDVRVRLNQEETVTTDDIKKIWVRNYLGELISLGEIVDIVEKPTLLAITRKNRERAISITANVAKGQSQGEALQDVQKIAKEIMPEGYRMVLSGSAESFKESSNSLLIALVMGIFVAYMILASQFNSFVHPFTVLLALPFSITGAFIALYIGGKSLNMYSMIGIILLMGIVKKNSILLVDFTNERRAEGLSSIDALLAACPVRLRPILMTSFATIAGALPAALAIGPGAETRIPMALVVIGGVFVSTFLTLFVVPCAYSLLSRFENHQHDEDLKLVMEELKS